MKFIITGGHLTPAYSFIEEATSHGDQIEVIGCLPKSSVEASEFAKLRVAYHRIYSVKFDRYHQLISLFSLPGIIYPIAQSLRLVRAIRPTLILVFGSFNALPVAIAGFLLRIPVYLHEQTRGLGLANRIISRFAAGCALSYPDSQKHLNPEKTQVTGNLLRQSIWHPPKNPGFNLKPNHQPILFITGGNQGSTVLLGAIQPLISSLSKDYQLVIQHGRAANPDTRGLAIATDWFEAADLSWLLHHSRIIISRGGANTTAEIMAAGLPAIIIPLPKASADEQTQNAAAIASTGAGLLLPQTQLNPDNLLTAIRQIEANYHQFNTTAKTLAKLQHPQAAATLYQFITKKHH